MKYNYGKEHINLFQNLRVSFHFVEKTEETGVGKI